MRPLEIFPGYWKQKVMFWHVSICFHKFPTNFKSLEKVNNIYLVLWIGHWFLKRLHITAQIKNRGLPRKCKGVYKYESLALGSLERPLSACWIAACSGHFSIFRELSWEQRDFGTSQDPIFCFEKVAVLWHGSVFLDKKVGSEYDWYP